MFANKFSEKLPVILFLIVDSLKSSKKISGNSIPLYLLFNLINPYLLEIAL